MIVKRKKWIPLPKAMEGFNRINNPKSMISTSSKTFPKQDMV